MLTKYSKPDKQDANPALTLQIIAMEFTPLVGTETATVDDKGRILVSRKKRERLGNNFVLVVGDLGCLVAYPEAAWLKIASEVLNVPSVNRGRMMLTRLMMAEAVDELKCDDQGRFVLPPKLRAKAKIEKEVLLVGLGDRVEIWAQAEWDKFEEFGDGYGKDRRESFDKAFQLMTSPEATAWQATSQ